jgi:hypothetical protein
MSNINKKREQFKKELEAKLKKQLNLAKSRKNKKVLKIQNKAINKINKLNIEYKYEKATKSMIHD